MEECHVRHQAGRRYSTDCGRYAAPAQQVISEPGYCACFYPNANCQNKGFGNAYTDPNAQRGMAPRGQTVGAAVKRRNKPAAAARRSAFVRWHHGTSSQRKLARPLALTSATS